MSSSEDDAVQKFMATPELVEKLLLPFLDTGSTKHLAEAHGLTLEVLGKALSWDKLIKRTFPVDHEAGIFMESENLRARFLAEIVRMTKNSNSDQMASNWLQMERALLHSICERFPAYPVPNPQRVPLSGIDLIAVSCSCLKTHMVSTWGFLLLEEIEGEFGSHLQPILKIQIDYMLEEEVDLLSAISARAQRGPDVIQKMELHFVWCNSLTLPSCF